VALIGPVMPEVNFTVKDLVRSAVRGLLLSLFVQRFKDEFRSHGDCRFQTSINGASIREDTMHARRGLPIPVLGFQSHPHMDMADHEHVLLEFDLAHSFADQASSRRANLTRLQRASEGSGESARRRGNNVVKRRCARFGNGGGNFVVFHNCAVDTENHRLGLCRKIRLPNRPFHSLDSHCGTIHHFTHAFLRSVGFSLNLRRSALAIQALVLEAPFKRQILR